MAVSIDSIEYIYCYVLHLYCCYTITCTYLYCTTCTHVQYKNSAIHHARCSAAALRILREHISVRVVAYTYQTGADHAYHLELHWYMHLLF